MNSEGVAPAHVARRRLAVEPHERDHRQHEVDGAVVDVPERHEPVGAEERLLDRVLVVEAEELLGVDDLLRVAERVGARAGGLLAQPVVQQVDARRPTSTSRIQP